MPKEKYGGYLGIGLAILVVLFLTGNLNLPGAVVPPNPNQPPSVCTVPLSVAQTLQVGAQNFDTGAALAATNTVYISTATGQTNPGGTTTTPGSSYTVLTNSTATTFFSSLNPITTPCNTPSPQLSVRLKAVDTAISMSVVNGDGLTVNSNTNTQTLTALSPTTVILRLQPSGIQKHLSGEIGKFAVFLNASQNSTLADWDTSRMSVMFQGQQCARLGGTNPTSVINTIIGFGCTGDFTGADTAFYPVSVTLAPSAAYAAGMHNVTMSVVGYDYYSQVTSNALSPAGSLQNGPVKDDGSAIKTIQTTVMVLR